MVRAHDCTNPHGSAQRYVNTKHLFPAMASGVATRSSSTAFIGAEVELLVRDAHTGAIARLDGAMGEWLRVAAASGAWTSQASSKGAPKYCLPNGGTITLEPGGQMELSSAPHRTPRALVEAIHTSVSDLEWGAADFGLVLNAVGIDPVHSLAETPLQLTAERYTRMDRYFSAISPSGARMMRQTAALQVSVDAAHDPVLCWNALNRAAPAFTALFANSRMYEGRDSGYASYRAQMWRELDPSRTGVIPDAAGYDAFAKRARSMADAPAYRAFDELDNATDADWDLHLSTLFPEIRPKKYFEVRCIDSIPVRYVAAPILLVASLAWDLEMLEASAKFLPEVNEARLLRAARDGMRDESLAEEARELVRLTVAACDQRGADFASAADITALTDWLDRSLASGGAPFEHDLVRNDHVPDDAVAGLGKRL